MTPPPCGGSSGNRRFAGRKNWTENFFQLAKMAALEQFFRGFSGGFQQVWLKKVHPSRIWGCFLPVSRSHPGPPSNRVEPTHQDPRGGRQASTFSPTLEIFPAKNTQRPPPRGRDQLNPTQPVPGTKPVEEDFDRNRKLVESIAARPENCYCFDCNAHGAPACVPLVSVSLPMPHCLP